MSTAPLRDALADALPERPFRVSLWDGTELPPTSNGDGPVFSVRSPVALAHMSPRRPACRSTRRGAAGVWP